MFKEVKDGETIVIESLTKEEKTIHNNLKGKITKIEKQVKKLNTELSKLKSYCKHTALKDVYGYPYDIRECATCGQFISFI